MHFRSHCCAEVGKFRHIFSSSLVKPHTLFFISCDIECREGAGGCEVSRTITLFHVANSHHANTFTSRKILLKTRIRYWSEVQVAE